MATRDQLIEIGRDAIELDDQALINAGLKVLRDGIREYLSDKGLSEAVGFVVTLKNGEQFTVLSDENPKMETPMDQVASIDAKQSAKAGGLDLAGNLLSVTLLF